MSLILEALRKSEAERRLGSAPDLLTAMPVMRMSAPRSRWPLAMAGGLLLLAVLASTWWWTRSAHPSPAIAIVAPAPQAAAKNEAGANATSPMHREVSQTPADVRATRPPPPIANAAPIQPRAATIAPPIASPPAVTEPVKSAAASATIAPPVPAAPVPIAEPALLSLADLSADERNGLPALKVSMHVYAEESAHRFMIIDGQRVAEGARLADGVVLVRIRRDGAEIDVRGRRLLLPKP